MRKLLTGLLMSAIAVTSTSAFAAPNRFTCSVVFKDNGQLLTYSVETEKELATEKWRAVIRFECRKCETQVYRYEDLSQEVTPHGTVLIRSVDGKPENAFKLVVHTYLDLPTGYSPASVQVPPVRGGKRTALTCAEGY